MGAWIMSVVGVICLGVLLEIVLPSGKTTKYVRGTFSLLVVYVIDNTRRCESRLGFRFRRFVFHARYERIGRVEFDDKRKRKGKTRASERRVRGYGGYRNERNGNKQRESRCSKNDDIGSAYS